MINHPYTITFPIWKCEQWSALRGRLKLTDESIVVARFTDTTFLDEEIAFLEQHCRIKPQPQDRLTKATYKLLPSILQIIRTNHYTDIVFDNCSQWQLPHGDLSKLLLAYFAYDLYTDMPSPRDCTLENLIRNGDSLVVLDFGLRKRTEKYSPYWNPLILKGKPYYTSYQWSLGVMYLVMTQGQFMLSQISKKIDEWLNGSRLNVDALLTSKKPAIQNLISALLSPENPIPWEMIPHHSAFRDDPACRQILKEFQNGINGVVRESREVRVRSSSRMSSRNSVSPTIMPNPQSRQGRRSSLILDSSQNLISKVNTMYKIHQEKVKQGIAQQQNKKITLKFTKQFNNFFTTTKLRPKTLKTQIQSQGPKSFRNFGQNTTNRGEEESLTSGRRLSQDENRVQTQYERLRSRIGSIKLSQRSIYTSQKTIQQTEKNEVEYKQVNSQASLQMSSDVSPNQSPKIQKQDLDPEIPEISENNQSVGENYIQLIKSPVIPIENFINEYTRGLNCINIVGQTVAKCIEYLNGLHNFWVIPLFLAFKRMLQLRLEVAQLLEDQQNIFHIDQWQDVCKSKEYVQFETQVKQDNYLVTNEMQLLLKAAIAKSEKLESSKRERVEWFLNEDINQNIGEVCHTYLYTQVYRSVKERKGIQKPYIDWLKLAIQVQASIFICGKPALQCEKGSFSYESYQEALAIDDIQEIGNYIYNNEQYLE